MRALRCLGTTIEVEEVAVSEAKQTTDHGRIKAWIEGRDGRPCKVATSAEGGILRIDFRETEKNFEEITWEEFFDIFDKSRLAFLYQEETRDGKKSRFNKFISRET
jgi:hypothetical protein